MDINERKRDKNFKDGYHAGKMEMIDLIN